MNQALVDPGSIIKLTGDKMKLMTTTTLAFLFEPLPIWAYVMALFAGISTWLFGDLGYSMGFLMSFTFLDLISGMLKHWIKKDFNYRKIDKTVYKLLGYVAFVVLLRIVFHLFLPSIPGLDPHSSLMSESTIRVLSIVPHFMIAMLSFKEINSNITNFSESGIIPKRVIGLFSKLSDRFSKHVNDNIPGIDLDNGDESG